jgi:hypothetical protein
MDYHAMQSFAIAMCNEAQTRAAAKGDAEMVSEAQRAVELVFRLCEYIRLDRLARGEFDPGRDIASPSPEQSWLVKKLRSHKPDPELEEPAPSNQEIARIIPEEIDDMRRKRGL